jgi:hypothetical protein
VRFYTSRPSLKFPGFTDFNRFQFILLLFIDISDSPPFVNFLKHSGPVFDVLIFFRNFFLQFFEIIPSLFEFDDTLLFDSACFSPLFSLLSPVDFESSLFFLSSVGFESNLFFSYHSCVLTAYFFHQMFHRFINAVAFESSFFYRSLRSGLLNPDINRIFSDQGSR